MPRNEYQSELAALRADVVAMSELVIERLEMSLRALEYSDAELAAEVIDGDDDVNQLYLDLEKQCTDLIAPQQPVAGDLRFIAASFKIITDLERIADLAVNLGEYAKDADNTVFPGVDSQQLGEEALEMVSSAMEAYAEEDSELCYAIDRHDDELDALCEDASDTVVRELIEGEGLDQDDIEAFMSDVSRLLLTIRDLERVGDHAVNIAARTLYMIESNDELIY